MSDKIATGGWLVWRIAEGKPQFFAVYESRELAEREISALAETPFGADWQISGVIFAGFGVHRETGRLYSNEDRGPPTTGTKQ